MALATLSHVLAAALVVLLLPDWRGTALASVVVLLGALQWQHRFRQDSVAVISGIRHDANGWALRFGCAVAGSWQPARLSGTVFCHQHLVVLRFRGAGHLLSLAVAVTHDSCSVEEFRRLRVLARHLPAPQLWAASR